MAATDLLEPFRATFTGVIVTPTDETYEEDRRVWNGTIDLRPAVIARCDTVDDIVAAVLACRDSGVAVAVRGGGHSVAGLSACDDGVLIDLSTMREVIVDPDVRVASVEPGARWSDFDAATAEYGLATTGGLISTTGVAGLTLGGGIGWLQRKYGLSCDNLIAADVVTAAGTIVHTSETERPELLWGLRGGGGNFGIVSRFVFQLHPVDTVYGGLLMYPYAQGREVLTAFRDWARDLPDEASMMAAIIAAPPEPFVPGELVGQRVVGIAGCWCGTIDAGAVALEPMRALDPAVDVFAPMPYVALQSMIDATAPKGLRNYFRSGYLDALDDDTINALLAHGARMPSPMSQVHLHQMGGAVGRITDGDTAFTGRGAAFTYNLVSTWVEPSEDGVHIEANREFAAEMEPRASARTYVNFIGGTDQDRVRAAYGDVLYDRLARLKATYDPTNLFCRNQNIVPAAPSDDLE